MPIHRNLTSIFRGLMKPACSVIVLVLAAVGLLSAQTATPPRRSITDKDLFDFVWIANPQLAPDGSRVAFTRVVVDEKRTGYETSIWMVATSGTEAALRLTNGKHDSQPRWSPDGHRLAFVRGGEKDDTGKPKPPQIAILSLAGGEARIVTDLPKGAANPAWSPDSKRIAFLSTTTSEDIEKAKKKAADQPAKPGDKAKNSIPSDSEHESDVHVISRAVYRDNDEGYLDPKRHEHIWALDVPGASDEVSKPWQLTSGDYDEGDFHWTNDGARIYYLTSRVDEPYYEQPTTDIYFVSSTGGAPEKLITIAMGIGDFTLSPDGHRAAFHALGHAAGSVVHATRSLGDGSRAERATAESHGQLRLRHGRRRLR